MTPEATIALLEELEGEALLLEPRDRYDQCLVGVAQRFNDTFALYSRSCILRVIAEDAADDDDEDPETSAIEHFEFNIIGGWVGSGTPGFVLEDDE